MSTLQDLFDTDPLELTRENLDEMIDYIRKQRHSFAAMGKAATVKAEKPAPVAGVEVEL